MRRAIIRPILLLAAIATGLTPGGSASAVEAACSGVLFDDFSYESHQDARLAQRGWQLRNGGGGPGIGGEASWSSANVSSR